MTPEEQLRLALEQIGDAIDQAIRLIEGDKDLAVVVLRNASDSAHELGNGGGGPQ